MIGDELRTRRLHLGFTQAELAAHLEVAPNTVARWERGAVVIPRPAVLRLVLDGIEAQHTQRLDDDQDYARTWNARTLRRAGRRS